MFLKRDIHQLTNEKIDAEFPGSNPIHEALPALIYTPAMEERSYHTDTKLALEMITICEQRIEAVRLERNMPMADIIAGGFKEVRSNFLGNAITLHTLMDEATKIENRIYALVDWYACLS